MTPTERGECKGGDCDCGKHFLLSCGGKLKSEPQKESEVKPCPDDLMEQLAAIEHERWSSWHIHSVKNETVENVTRWNKQAVTPYQKLPEHSKDLDRKEVMRYWPIVSAWAHKRIAELVTNCSQLEKQLEIAREHLAEYGNHVNYCIRLFQEAGEPTKDGGYRVKFKGKWYQAEPVDETPKCECGFDEALASIRCEMDCKSMTTTERGEHDCCGCVLMNDDIGCNCMCHFGDEI